MEKIPIRKTVKKPVSKRNALDISTRTTMVKVDKNVKVTILLLDKL